MRMNYGIVVALVALLATVQARTVALPTPTPTPTPTPVSAAKQSVATAPTPAATPTPLSTVKQSGAVVTATPTPVSAAKQSVATAHPTPAATPTPLSTVKQSGVVVTATPTPAVPQVPIRQAPALTGPVFSPAQLDFGTIDFRASSRKTLLLTATSSGEITMRIGSPAFSAVEQRRVPPAQGKNQPLHVVPTRPFPIWDGSPFQVYKWNLVAGEQMQLDILFNPQAASWDSTSGPRIGSLVFTGPGPQGWLVSVPLKGMVTGLVVQPNPQTPPSVRPRKRL